MSCDSLHVGLAEAARKHFPGRPNPSTVWRWATKGHSDGRGGRIRLKVSYVGRRVVVTPDACREFIEAVTNAKLAKHVEADEPRSADRSADTEQQLREAGLL